MLSMLTGKELSNITRAPVAHFDTIREIGCFNSTNFTVCILKSEGIFNTPIPQVWYFYYADIHNINNKAGHVFISSPNITMMDFNVISKNTDVLQAAVPQTAMSPQLCYFLHGKLLGS